MQPRLDYVLRSWEREKVAVGQMKVVGKMGLAFYKDFAPDGAANQKALRNTVGIRG